MFLGHIAVGLAGKRAVPSLSLGTWILSVQFVDLIWPMFLLAGVEHVRIAPGITAFTPLDFYDYPITHSLVAVLTWGALLGGLWRLRGSSRRAALLLGAGVVSHWLLDAVSHRPDVPVLPRGPYVGLGLWHSVPLTLAIELTGFAIGLMLYARGGLPGTRRVSFWLFIALLAGAYFAAAFGPPPPDVTTLAVSALALWILVPIAWWVDRDRRAAPAPG